MSINQWYLYKLLSEYFKIFIHLPSVCGPNNFWFGNKGTDVVLMSLLTHRTTCHINAIDIHKTYTFHAYLLYLCGKLYDVTTITSEQLEFLYSQTRNCEDHKQIAKWMNILEYSDSNVNTNRWSTSISWNDSGCEVLCFPTDSLPLQIAH